MQNILDKCEQSKFAVFHIFLFYFQAYEGNSQYFNILQCLSTIENQFIGYLKVHNTQPFVTERPQIQVTFEIQSCKHCCVSVFKIHTHFLQT
jgi:hypothetical protein